MPQSYSPVDFPQDWSQVSMSASNQFTDAPSDDAGDDIGNHATWNPLATAGGSTYTIGNTTFRGDSTADDVAKGTIAVSSGKYYWRIYLDAVQADGYPQVGIQQINKVTTLTGGFAGSDDFTWVIFCQGSGTASPGGQGRHNSSETSQILSGIVATDYIDHALDMDAGKLWWGRNGTFSGDPAAGSGEAYSGITGTVYPFANTYTSSNATIDITGGTAPSGYGRLSTADLPKPTVTNPSDHFTVKTLVNGGTPNTSFDTGLASVGLIMDKRTDGTGGWEWWDIARGANALLQSDNNDDEVTKSGNSFSGGTFNFDNTTNIGAANTSHIVYSWIAGGAPSSDEGGAITSNVSAAGHGGFSVGTYSGTGSASTVGHGLSRAPSWVIVKMRSGSGTQTWTTWQEDIADALGSDRYIILSAADAATNGASFSSTAPTSSAFSVGNDATNQSSSTFCFWAFAKTPGLIASGSYTGNGSSDGPAVVVDDGASGFKPAWLMIRSMAAGNWNIVDATRDPFNPVDEGIRVNSNIAEFSGQTMDFLANGFKLRLSGSDYNTSSQKYIYLAMAENPFGGSSIAQARAR